MKSILRNQHFKTYINNSILVDIKMVECFLHCPYPHRIHWPNQYLNKLVVLNLVVCVYKSLESVFNINRRHLEFESINGLFKFLVSKRSIIAIINNLELSSQPYKTSDASGLQLIQKPCNQYSLILRQLDLLSMEDT